MAKRKKSKKKARPGVGAQASVLAKFIHPKGVISSDGRVKVVLTGREDKKVNRKQQTVYTFTTDAAPDRDDLYAVKSHFKVEKEGGSREELFDPLSEGDDDDADDDVIDPLKEPKEKWRKSKAKKMLYDDVKNGLVPLEAKDSEGNTIMASCTTTACP